MNERMKEFMYAYREKIVRYNISNVKIVAVTPKPSIPQKILF